MTITVDEMWNSIYRAYEAGLFGPPAFPRDPLPVQMHADRVNLIHLAAGATDGLTPMSDTDKGRLVAALEELFAGELYFQLSGFLSFKTLSGLKWRPKAAGPF